MALALAPNRLALAEYKRNIHRVTVDAGTKFSEVLTPEFWVHAAKGLRKGDKIEIVAADNAYYGELLVLSTQDKGALVRQISYINFDEKAVVAASKPEVKKPDFVVQYKGSSAKYCVLRTADNELIKQGCDTKEQAAEWLEQYELGLAS